MSRLDRYLVENSLVPSRTKAQEIIQSGGVEVFLENHFQVMRRPSFKVDEFVPPPVRLLQTDLLKYVARSGLKLEHAIKKLGLDPKAKRALDIGLSTGGFAHCLLEHGVMDIVGVDVGRGQLHPRLKNHPRLISLEGFNARYLRRDLKAKLIHAFQRRQATQIAKERAIADNETVLESLCVGGASPLIFDLITIDVSFISLEHILPEIPFFLAEGGEFLALVKPQFETEKGRLNLLASSAQKDSTSKVYGVVERKIISFCESLNLDVKSYFMSQPMGRDGSREFFIYGRRWG